MRLSNVSDTARGRPRDACASVSILLASMSRCRSNPATLAVTDAPNVAPRLCTRARGTYPTHVRELRPASMMTCRSSLAACASCTWWRDRGARAPPPSARPAASEPQPSAPGAIQNNAAPVRLCDLEAGGHGGDARVFRRENLVCDAGRRLANAELRSSYLRANASCGTFWSGTWPV